jgi:hypothetical protein
MTRRYLPLVVLSLLVLLPGVASAQFFYRPYIGNFRAPIFNQAVAQNNAFAVRQAFATSYINSAANAQLFANQAMLNRAYGNAFARNAGFAAQLFPFNPTTAVSDAFVNNLQTAQHLYTNASLSRATANAYAANAGLVSNYYNAFFPQPNYAFYRTNYNYNPYTSQLTTNAVYTSPNATFYQTNSNFVNPMANYFNRITYNTSPFYTTPFYSGVNPYTYVNPYAYANPYWYTPSYYNPYMYNPVAYTGFTPQNSLYNPVSSGSNPYVGY